MLKVPSLGKAGSVLPFVQLAAVVLLTGTGALGERDYRAGTRQHRRAVDSKVEGKVKPPVARVTL